MLLDYYDIVTDTWRTNQKYNEILKLDRMLTEANIPHTLNKLMDGYQLCYPTNRNSVECIMDAIEHSGSYGHECDKLEIMGLLTPEEEEDDSVLGYLSAEEVFERIRKHWNGEWDDYISESSTNSPMTPEEFSKKMAELKYDLYDVKDDEELVHSEMDDLMCNLLRNLGYGDGIDIFDETPKWYA